MKICPSCGYEYRDEITVCPECQVTLAQDTEWERPAESALSEEAWTELEEIPPPASPEMIKDILEQNEIPCLLQGRYYGEYFSGAGERDIRIMVPASKLEEAQEIIAAFFKEAPEDIKIVSCPHCGEQIENYRIVCPKCKEPTGWD